MGICLPVIFVVYQWSPDRVWQTKRSPASRSYLKSDMETLSVLLALCEGNPPSSHKGPDMWYFCYGFPELLNKPLICQRFDSMWRHGTELIHIMGQSPGAHFANDFSIVVQIRWNFHSALIQVAVKWSLWNFARGTTAVLSWHVQIL